jgi:hypothetical protein
MNRGAQATIRTTDVDVAETARPRRKPIDRGHVVSYLLLLGIGAVYLGPMLMLLNTALKTQPGFAKDPIGLS